MNVSELIGQTIRKIQNDNNERLSFTMEDGSVYAMFHIPDCCESVYIEDIVGNLDDLLNTTLFLAEEVSSEGTPPLHEYAESYTWTFYKFGTLKGYVTIRWYGTSNGYYSERVSFEKISD